MMSAQIEDFKKAIHDIIEDLYSLDCIASEIIDFTQANQQEVWRRLCLEISHTGFNVSQESHKFNVTPHYFDENMLLFYKKSDGFIYETMVESRNPYRMKKWLNIVEFMLENSEYKPHEKKVLLYGDSVGSDSIFLNKLGFEVYYHDFESYCSSFANYRFKKRGLSINKYSREDKNFDFVICLEVAEHVPDPLDLVRELSSLTSLNGCCIFSEAFNLVLDNFPTHLATNIQYAGKVDELFRSVGMNVLWKDVDNKPIVYAKYANSISRYPRESSIHRVKKIINKVIRRGA